jgi:hypothetical protein
MGADLFLLPAAAEENQPLRFPDGRSDVIRLQQRVRSARQFVSHFRLIDTDAITGGDSESDPDCEITS